MINRKVIHWETISKSGKQFLNFINTRNKRKHENYELDDIEDK